jgi:glycopeptide antibiotics resistance protein
LLARFHRELLFLWFVFIGFVYFFPFKNNPETGWLGKYQIDKFVHFAIFFILIFLHQNTHSKVQGKPIMSTRTFLCIAVLLGFMLEWLQPQISTHRFFDYADIFANTIGCLLGHYLTARKTDQKE